MLRYSLFSAELLLGFSALAALAGDLPLMTWPARVTRPAEQGALGQFVKQRYKSIFSTGFYLDQPRYTSYHYQIRSCYRG